MLTLASQVQSTGIIVGIVIRLNSKSLVNDGAALPPGHARMVARPALGVCEALAVIMY